MRWIALFLVGLIATSLHADVVRLAFGSCADADKPDHPIWDALYQAQPDALLMIGDNVYADSPSFRSNPSRQGLETEYAKLGAAPLFRRLRASIPVYATWDDHDYGLNDGGGEFALKDVSQQVFFDFWQVAADRPERQTPGIYAERWLDKAGMQIQILLLDTRYFRSALTIDVPDGRCPVRNYGINVAEGVTILGRAQWQWLEERLQEPADVRVIASSIQVVADQHCWERWGAFPKERARLFRLIASSGARNIFFVSGDRHLGEISKLSDTDDFALDYPLYDITSSPLSARSGFGKGEVNRYRVGHDNVRVSNFGMIEVDAVKRQAVLSLRDSVGETLVGTSVFLR
ncbi:MAG: alkaline phosphatase D family protein [Pseudomonadales bacterium]